MINSAFSLAFNGSALLSNQKEMIWNKSIFQVTTSTDGHGTMTASPMSGFSGTQVTLNNTPNTNYGFQGYSVTGATLTGNKFTLNNDVTARAIFSAQPVTGSAGAGGVTYTKMVMIPLASSNGRNAQACCEKHGSDFNIGINAGQFRYGSYEAFSTYKSIYSSTKPMKISAQTTTGAFQISGFYNTNTTATWGFRLAGMKPVYYDIFGTATLAGYDFTGFGNSYTRDYNGRDTWTAKDFYHTTWLYDAARDRKLLTAEIPAGYIPVIIECYVGGNANTATISGSGAPDYDWSYTAEI